MFKEYYKLFEKCEKIENPNYEQLKEIKKEWDKLTLEFFKSFDIKDFTELFTRLNEDLCDKNNYFNNFTSSLSYYSDRMNLNRWCRLQLLLENAIEEAYDIE